MSMLFAFASGGNGMEGRTWVWCLLGLVWRTKVYRNHDCPPVNEMDFYKRFSF